MWLLLLLLRAQLTLLLMWLLLSQFALLLKEGAEARAPRRSKPSCSQCSGKPYERRSFQKATWYQAEKFWKGAHTLGAAVFSGFSWRFLQDIEGHEVLQGLAFVISHEWSSPQIRLGLLPVHAVFAGAVQLSEIFLNGLQPAALAV